MHLACILPACMLALCTCMHAQIDWVPYHVSPCQPTTSPHGAHRWKSYDMIIKGMPQLCLQAYVLWVTNGARTLSEGGGEWRNERGRHVGLCSWPRQDPHCSLGYAHPLSPDAVLIPASTHHHALPPGRPHPAGRHVHHPLRRCCVLVSVRGCMCVGRCGSGLLHRRSDASYCAAPDARSHSSLLPPPPHPHPHLAAPNSPPPPIPCRSFVMFYSNTKLGDKYWCGPGSMRALPVAFTTTQ